VKAGVFICVLLCGLSNVLYAQIGGRYAFDFLNLSPSARVTALGGVNISTLDDDINMGYQNPALVNDSMHHHMVLTYSSHLADINYGYAGYSRTYEGIGSFHAGIQYVDYGTMTEADPFGNVLGEFSAGEFVVVLGGSRGLGPMRYGTQIKVVQSSLADGYTSWAIAADLGAVFESKNSLFSAGIVLRNAGVQLNTYADEGSREPLPLQLMVGISNRLKYLPLRFSITAIHLEHPTLAREDPNQPQEFDLNQNPIDLSPTFVDNLFRHLVFGGEFYFGRALRLRAGYNHMRRQELRPENRGGGTGFSFGVGIRINRIMLDYGYGSYGVNSLFHTHQFGLILNLNPLSRASKENS